MSIENRSDYYAEVADYAESVKDELREQIKEGNEGEPLREWLLEHLHETCDGAHCVIYTYEAQQVLAHSDNDNAYYEEFGADGAVNESGINWSALAYCAFERDIIEHLDGEGIDVNEPDSDESKEALGIEEEEEADA